MNKRLEAEIFGRVQGVGFRVFIKDKAAQLNLHGVVSNTSKGTVKVIAEGPIDKLETFLKELFKGPIFSNVKEIKHTIIDFKNEYKDFQIIKENKLLKDQFNSYKNFAMNILK